MGRMALGCTGSCLRLCLNMYNPTCACGPPPVTPTHLKLPGAQCRTPWGSTHPCPPSPRAHPVSELPPLLSSHSKVFFTDYGQIPKVERCDMDGQNRTKLVDSKIVFPHGITLDLVNRLVYWADAYLDYIEVVDYEGKNRHTIIQGILVSGFGAEGWYQSSVFWVLLICSCDLSVVLPRMILCH